MRHHLQSLIVRVNSLTRDGRIRNAQGKRHALAGYGADPYGWDALTLRAPLTAWAWGLTRRFPLSPAYVSWVAGLR